MPSFSTIRSSSRSVVNTLAFLIIGINLKMVLALLLSGFFVTARTWIRWLSLLFILPWAVPSIPTILSFRFMLNPEWGIINQTIFRLTAEDGPNWLNDPTLGARTGDRRAHLEVAALLDADLDRRAARHPGRALRGGLRRRRQRLAEVPAHHLAVDADALPHLHDPLDDLDARRLQQRLPLTGGGPADLTHVLATLGIRYLRLDEVDMSMAAIVIALPFILPLVFFMMRRLSK